VYILILSQKEEKREKNPNPKVRAAAGPGILTFHNCKQLSYGHDQMLLRQERIKEGDTVSFCSHFHIFWSLLFFVLMAQSFETLTFTILIHDI
jgi:hypothetical protein